MNENALTDCKPCFTAAEKEISIRLTRIDFSTPRYEKHSIMNLKNYADALFVSC